MIPFPQANNLERAFRIFSSISEDGISNDAVHELEKITARQGSYYLCALQFIGLIEKVHSKFFLNQHGYEIRKLPNDYQRAAFAVKILENRELNSLYVKSSKSENRKDKLDIISKSLVNTGNMNETTAFRRASTVLSWFNWISRYKDNNN